MGNVMHRVAMAATLALLGGLVLADEPREWRGPLVEFTKADYADPTDAASQDRITDRVWLTRGDQQGLFNIRQEPGYGDDRGEGGDGAPTGTLWADGDAADWATLDFRSWREWADSNPPGTVDRDAVLHLVEQDVYLDVRFTSWTQGEDQGGPGGGGFAYERATEGVPGEKVWTGPLIRFTKPDFADWGQAVNQDRVADGVWITRQDEQGLFNIAREPSFRAGGSGPPTGTAWAIGSVSDVDSLAFGSWRSVTGGNPPALVGRDAIVHLLQDDVFVPIRFTSWTEGPSQGGPGGGGFAYVRATEGVPGERIWTGPDLTFTKIDFANPSDPANQDTITQHVILTRRDTEGLFNVVEESAYNARPSPPEGTEWAFGRAVDHGRLLFSSWNDWHGGSQGGGPASTIGRDAVVHLIDADVFIDIRFLSWTQGANGGGFSYERATEGRPGEQVWTGPTTTFTKADFADFGMAANQDRIMDGVWLTRQDQRGLYNIAREVSHYEDERSSPTGTEWAYGQIADIPDLAFGSWRALSGGDPRDMVGRDAIVHLIADDVYVPIRFTSWTSGGDGGGFSYDRATEAAPGETVWTGPTLSFSKADYADPDDPANQDRIAGDVHLTRGDSEGLYNAALDRGHRAGPFRPSPPSGTEWAYGDAADWQALVFRSWEDWHGGSNGGDGGPPGTVGRPAVLRLVDADVYLDIEFTSWTSDGEGGGFSYVRATEGVPGEKVWTGPVTTFSKSDFADWGQAANQDRITSDVWITRQDRRGLFNPRAEVGYVRAEDERRLLAFTEAEEDGERGSPPAGTVWAMGSLDDRELLAFGPWEDFHSGRPPSVVGKQAILHLVEENVYLGIRFTSWTQSAEGGGFSYERTSPLVAGTASVKGKFNFKKTSKDKLIVKGTVDLPESFDPEGKELHIDVGGVSQLFVLDRKGRAKTETGKAVLKYLRRTGSWAYVVQLKKGDFAAALEDDGVVNDTRKKVPVSLTVTVSVDGLAFGSTSEYLYTGKAGKKGKLK